MRKIISVLGIIFIMATIVSCSSDKSGSDVLNVGVVQLVEHEALDDIREGTIAKLVELGYSQEKGNINLDIQNAQGDFSNINSIVQKFIGNEVDLIVAIATPPAQVAVGATTTIPIIFSGITDPLDAGLVNSLETPGKNASGVGENFATGDVLKLARELTPDVKTFGLLYDSSQVNSAQQIQNLKDLLDTEGYNYKEKTITNVNELQQATLALITDVDALFLINDNTIASALPVVTSVAKEQNKAIYSTSDTFVNEGALASVATNYYKVGLLTGEMVAQVLEGADISTMPVRYVDEFDVIVNEDTGKDLNIDVSKYTN